jgi:hypothetical protein
MENYIYIIMFRWEGDDPTGFPYLCSLSPCTISKMPLQRKKKIINTKLTGNELDNCAIASKEGFSSML